MTEAHTDIAAVASTKQLVRLGALLELLLHKPFFLRLTLLLSRCNIIRRLLKLVLLPAE
jgi:hypothetical protein